MFVVRHVTEQSDASAVKSDLTALVRYAHFVPDYKLKRDESRYFIKRRVSCHASRVTFVRPP